jgi:UDP-N-acetylmuramate-alanine ligase
VISTLRVAGRTAESFASADKIADYLGDDLRERDVVLVLSNGSFDGLCDKLLTRLSAKSLAPRGVR